MKYKLIVVILGIFLVGTIIQVSAENFNIVKYNLKQEEFNKMDFFDVGVGFPSDILFGQTRFVGDDSFFVTVSNNFLFLMLIKITKPRINTIMATSTSIN